MARKIVLILLILGLITATSFGQKVKPNSNEQDNKEQLARIRLETELLRIQSETRKLNVPTLRVFIFYRLATSIWKDKISKPSVAKELALEAFADLHENKATIPDLYFKSFNTGILALLEIYAPESIPKLKAKYETENSQSALDVALELLKNRNGAKLALAKLKSSFREGEDYNQLTVFFLIRLQDERNPTLADVLSEIIAVEERNNESYSISSLFWLIHFFRDPLVDSNLWNRFVFLVLKSVQKVMLSTQENTDKAFNLINAIIPDLEKRNPASAILAEAYSARTGLYGRISKAEKEAEEAYRKIRESDDKLSATISQAESVNDASLKEELYDEAAKLALQQSKFKIAVELIEKIDFSKDENKLLWHDQFLGEIVTKSLQKKDMESALLANSKISAKLSQALSFQKLGIYYLNNKDFIFGNSSFDSALKLINEGEDNKPAKINAYLRFLSDTLTTKSNRTVDVIIPISEAINTISTPAADVKPEDDNYKKYVTSIIQIDWNLFWTMQDLATNNKDIAEELALRINNKEVKIIADSALWVKESKDLRKVIENKNESSK